MSQTADALRKLDIMQEPLERNKPAFQWLVNLPCVLRGEIQVDVRSCWPILIRGMAATTCMTKGDAVDFIVAILPVISTPLERG